VKLGAGGRGKNGGGGLKKLGEKETTVQNDEKYIDDAIFSLSSEVAGLRQSTTLH
jgi:hypothetical protein